MRSRGVRSGSTRGGRDHHRLGRGRAAAADGLWRFGPSPHRGCWGTGAGAGETALQAGHHPGAQRDSAFTLDGSAAVEHGGVRGVSEPLRGDPHRYGGRRPWAGASNHGSQYLSDHFLKQIRYWGIHPSFGVEPETGVAERWNRTLKEQAIHGRIFQNLEAVRAAVADFVERYNQTWRLEKLGYHTPIEAREEYELRQAA